MSDLVPSGDTTEPLAELVINPFVTSPVLSADTEAQALPPLPFSLKQWQHTQEKDALDAALQRAQFNQREAAQLLNLTYHQFRGLLKNMPAARNRIKCFRFWLVAQIAIQCPVHFNGN